MRYALAGEVVYCENGHAAGIINRDIMAGEVIYANTVAGFALDSNGTFPQCKDCKGLIGVGYWRWDGGEAGGGFYFKEGFRCIQNGEIVHFPHHPDIWPPSNPIMYASPVMNAPQSSTIMTSLKTPREHEIYRSAFNSGHANNRMLPRIKELEAEVYRLRSLPPISSILTMHAGHSFASWWWSGFAYGLAIAGILSGLALAAILMK